MRNKTQPEEKKGTASWLISFADMVTLLLSFFIMLQAFASVRDPELFGLGQGGFKRAISGLGLPDWLFGTQEKVEQGHIDRKGPMEEDLDNDYPLDVIDAKDEKIRKLYQQLSRLRNVKADDQWGEPARWLATPIRFEPDQAALQDAAKTYLTGFASDLRQYGGAGAARISIVGLAPDAATPRDRWTLSARRAIAVEAFLTDILAEELAGGAMQIDSWGGGLGKHWYGDASDQAQQAFVVLALMQSQAEE